MRKRRCSVVLKVVLLGSFLLLLPFWLLGGSGSFDLCRQSIDVDAVIFGTVEGSMITSINHYLIMTRSDIQPTLQALNCDWTLRWRAE